MAEVTIYINGRSYEISCDNGQEGRIVDLARYVDQRLQNISRSGAAYNDAHLMVLTALVLTDELFDAKTQEKTQEKPARAQAAAQPETSAADDAALMRVLEALTKRIDGIATKVQAA